MSKWIAETMRSAAQLCYWRNYRYVQSERGNELDFQCDILAPCIEAEMAGGPEIFVGGDWLRRYMTGGWNRRTGHYYHTVPGPERLQAINDFIARKNMLTAAALQDHTGDAHHAARIAAMRKFNRFADQRLLAGTFRGTFHGSIETAYGMRESVLLIHFLPGEAYFRTRLFQAEYRRGTNENTSTRADAFASFGTNEGRIFGGDDQCEYHATGFSFDKKGRRGLALEIAGDDEDGKMRMTLCRQPGDIDRAIDLLHRFSALQRRMLAAE